MAKSRATEFVHREHRGPATGQTSLSEWQDHGGWREREGNHIGVWGIVLISQWRAPTGRSCTMMQLVDRLGTCHTRWWDDLPERAALTRRAREFLTAVIFGAAA